MQCLLVACSLGHCLQIALYTEADCWRAKDIACLQALEVHANAAGEPEAHEAMLVTLQCMHALMSGAGGMHGVLSTPGSLPALCAMLARRGEDEAAKLVVEMLIKLCLFSTEGYCLAIKVCILSNSGSLGGSTVMSLTD